MYLDPVLELHFSAGVYANALKCLSGAIVGGVATGLEGIDYSRLWYSARRICLDRTVAATVDVISYYKT